MLLLWIQLVIICQHRQYVTAAPTIGIPAIIGGSVAGGVVGLTAISMMVYLLFRTYKPNRDNRQDDAVSHGTKDPTQPLKSPQSPYVSPDSLSGASPVSPVSVFNPDSPSPKRPPRPPSLDFWATHARPFGVSKGSVESPDPPIQKGDDASRSIHARQHSSQLPRPTGPRPRPLPKSPISSSPSNSPHSTAFPKRFPASPPSSASPQTEHYQQRRPLLVTSSTSPRRVKTMEHLPPRKSSLTNLTHSFLESPLSPGFGNTIGVRVPPMPLLPSARRSGSSKGRDLELDVPDNVGDDSYSPGPSSAFVLRSGGGIAADPVLPRTTSNASDGSRYGGYPNRTGYVVGQRPHNFPGVEGRIKRVSRSLPQLRQ